MKLKMASNFELKKNENPKNDSEGREITDHAGARITAKHRILEWTDGRTA